MRLLFSRSLRILSPTPEVVVVEVVLAMVVVENAAA
jgi:hypothetical protein